MTDVGELWPFPKLEVEKKPVPVFVLYVPESGDSVGIRFPFEFFSFGWRA